jgi:hypothetical protein
MILQHWLRSEHPGSALRRGLAPAILVVLLGTALDAGAQVNGYTFFLERSYFLWDPVLEERTAEPQYYSDGYDRAADNLLFEARIAPHIFLLNTLDDELTVGGFAAALSFTPLITVRQLRGFSRPLKNPSFKPKVNLQFFWSRPSESEGEPMYLWAWQFIWGHHSNGGSGCLFVGESEVDGHCAGVDSIPPEDRQVDVNGSFSLTYGRAELYARRMIVEDGVVQNSWTFGLGMEINGANWPFLTFGGGATHELRRIYGPTRFYGVLELDSVFRLLWMDMRGTVGGRAQYIEYDRKPSPDASRWGGEAFAQITKDSGIFRGVGLYARYYEGQDYYNLLFIRDIRRIQVGISFDPTSNRWMD